MELFRKTRSVQANCRPHENDLTPYATRLLLRLAGHPVARTAADRPDRPPVYNPEATFANASNIRYDYAPMEPKHFVPVTSNWSPCCRQRFPRQPGQLSLGQYLAQVVSMYTRPCERYRITPVTVTNLNVSPPFLLRSGGLYFQLARRHLRTPYANSKRCSVAHTLFLRARHKFTARRAQSSTVCTSGQRHQSGCETTPFMWAAAADIIK